MARIPRAAAAARDAAGRCIDERRFVDAILHAERAVALAPDWAEPYWPLAVGYKAAHRWRDCLAAADRAIALDPEDSEGPRWNAGIAATALGDWDRARAAWASFGIPLPGDAGPIDGDFGLGPIRVNPDAHPEVVWCRRLDPCRARIRNVPMPGCGRSYDDLVLNDGEPRGERVVGERRFSVLDELIVLEPSTYRTWELAVRAADPAAIDAVVARFDDADGAAEDWTGVRMLCARCSLGGSSDDHVHDHDGGVAPWQPVRRLGIALRDETELDRLGDDLEVLSVTRVS